MKKEKVRQTAQDCVQQLREIHFEELGLSPYNLEYIQRILPELEYYFKIYYDAVNILFYKKEPKGWIVDFGGGHGFLSIFLKQLGFKVIYCDHNPLSVQAITLLSEKLGYGPDHIVEGNDKDLLGFCAVNKIKPAYLIGTDLIEHVYDLNSFFAVFHQINPAFEMVFTTGSNPCNPYKVRNLRKLMVEVEDKFFHPMRKEFIQKNYPKLSEKNTEELALLTRGLTYKDIEEAVDLFLETGEYPPEPGDKHNTCDPQNGNWMERVLPLKAYRQILKKNGFKVTFKKGYYNERRKSPLVSFAVRRLNRMIKYTGSLGRIPAAYLILKIERK